MSKSIKDFPPSVRDVVHELLANAAERKAKASQSKGA
jgi:hypothetical protein